jgi:SAM-dependent methyltransferase
MSSSGQDNRDDWDRHWDRFAQAATANPAQRMRHRLIARLLQAEARAGGNLRVCDFGSGQGDLIFGLSRDLPAAEFVGLELSTSGVEISRRKVPRARFEVADLFARIPEDFGLREWATHGVCSEVLEHVDDPRALLQAMPGYLAPGGVLVVTVPGGPMSAFDRHIGHRQHFTRASIAALLAAAGYAVDRTYLAGFPFFNLYRLTVIARGRKLVDDVTTRNGAAGSPLARAAMALYRGLFRFNLRDSPFGWQVVAVARKRG